MGTHPIFESDFDCLTDKKDNMVNSQMEFVLQNMQKGLEAQVEKVNKFNKEKENVGKRIGQFEAQLSETKVVFSELEILKEDAIVYKLLGPVLVKQDRDEALTTVKTRSSYMESELKKCETSLIDIGKKLAREQSELQDLHVKSQQIQKALEAGGP